MAENTKAMPQNAMSTSKLFARGAIIGGKRLEHWNPTRHLESPLHWRKPRLVILSIDLFHRDVPDGFIHKMFAVMALCREHTFLILTERADRMAEWFKGFSDLNEVPVFGDTGIGNWINGVYGNLMRDSGVLPGGVDKWRWSEPEMDFHEPWRVAVSGYYDWLGDDDERPIPWPLPNVILGVSVETDDYTWRIAELLRCPAALHFISHEPSLGELDVSPWLPVDTIGGVEMEPLIRWVIAGCESGPRRRPTEIAWIRSLRDQCVAAGIPFLLKQMDIGGKLVKSPELDGKQWLQFPQIIA